MTSGLLELNGITVSFDGFLALRDLNLSLQPGELRAVIGPMELVKPRSWM